MTRHPTPIRTRVAVTVQVAVVVAVSSMLAAPVPVPRWRGPRPGGEQGQSTVEYALILLGAAAIALVVVAWVTRTDAIGRLFDTVIGRVLQQAD